MNIEEAEARIRRFEQRMGNPLEFYVQHRPHWQLVARELTLATLLHLQPPDADPQEWRNRAESIASKVTAETFGGEDETGVLIYTEDLSQPVIFSDADTGAQEDNDITLADIERWVEQGREGVEGAKDLTLIDAGRTDTQIAWRVYRAMLNQRGSWERLMGHVKDFKGAMHQQTTDAMGADMLRVWTATLVPIIEADWQIYVAAEIARLG